jgi:hypothetical protein
MLEYSSANLLTQVVKAVVTNLPKGRDVKDIVADLRALRFDDEGVLTLIDAILDGTEAETDELSKRLAAFNDKEWKIAEIAARLMEHCPRVSNLTNEELQLIGWRKPRVREEIQRAINSWNQPKAQVNKKKLKKIRDGIRDLNRAIDDAEDKLLHGRKR